MRFTSIWQILPTVFSSAFGTTSAARAVTGFHRYRTRWQLCHKTASSVDFDFSFFPFTVFDSKQMEDLFCNIQIHYVTIQFGLCFTSSTVGALCGTFSGGEESMSLSYSAYQRITHMSFATLSKFFLFLLWPLIFLVIIYYNDKEKFKQRLKHFKFKDW